VNPPRTGSTPTLRDKNLALSTTAELEPRRGRVKVHRNVAPEYVALSEGGWCGSAAAVRDTNPAAPPKPRLLDRTREAVRARHDSHRTEKAYVHWIKRYIFFHASAIRSRWVPPK
jgi:Phage integrase, N-terminal SAM-like domain